MCTTVAPCVVYMCTTVALCGGTPVYHQPSPRTHRPMSAGNVVNNNKRKLRLAQHLASLSRRPACMHQNGSVGLLSLVAASSRCMHPCWERLSPLCVCVCVEGEHSGTGGPYLCLPRRGAGEGRRQSSVVHATTPSSLAACAYTETTCSQTPIMPTRAMFWPDPTSHSACHPSPPSLFVPQAQVPL